jgi:hypothetical protein
LNTGSTREVIFLVLELLAAATVAALLVSPWLRGTKRAVFAKEYITLCGTLWMIAMLVAGFIYLGVSLPKLPTYNASHSRFMLRCIVISVTAVVVYTIYAWSVWFVIRGTEPRSKTETTAPPDHH